MKSLVESLFDKDIVTKDPIDWSYFKMNPDQRYDLFFLIYSFMNDPDLDADHPEDTKLPEWMVEEYIQNQQGFDYIMNAFHTAFNKEHYDTWINIPADDFECMGDEMTDEQIDMYNEELRQYFAKATDTERGSYFVLGKGKLPEFILNIIKGTGYPVSRFNTLKNWAIDYYQCGSDQQLTIYGCPKSLDPIVKKILYN